MATFAGSDKAIAFLFDMVSNIASDYDNTSVYSVGDYAIHEGTLYKCTAAVLMPEDFTPAHWQTVLVMDEISSGGGGGGTTVIANPAGAATDTLNKLQVGATIYDVPSGGGSSGHTYSETEHIVGTWIDGSTIYEITFKKTGLNRVTGSTILIPHSEFPAGIDKILSLNATYIDSSGAAWTQNTYLSAANIIQTWLAGSGPDIYRWTQWGSAPTNATAYVTIQYTKTV